MKGGNKLDKIRCDAQISYTSDYLRIYSENTDPNHFLFQVLLPQLTFLNVIYWFFAYFSRGVYHALLKSFPGSNHLKKISLIKLRYASFECSDWLLKIVQPIRAPRPLLHNWMYEKVFKGSAPGQSFILCKIDQGKKRDFIGREFGNEISFQKNFFSLTSCWKTF